MSTSVSRLELNRELALKIGVGLGAFGLGYLAINYVLSQPKTCPFAHKKKEKTLLEQIPELNHENVKIRDLARVESILKNVKKDGKEHLQVVSDFDRTISLCTYEGKPCPTSFGILESSEFIDIDKRKQLNDLFHYYYPIEHDHSMTKEEKLPYMVEWWEKANRLIIDSKISKNDLQQIIKKSMTHLKYNCKQFFKQLEANRIPLLVFSAGLGDIIDEWMRHECGEYSNMKIVSNFIDFDEQTQTIRGFKGKMIHIFNKNESVLLDTAYEKTIHSRSNVILLGDSLGDVDMANGFPSLHNILKIGFLNTKVDALLPEYMAQFDIVLIHDDTFNIPNAILKHVL